MKPDVTANTQAVQASCWTKCRDGVSVFRLLKRCPAVTRLSSTTRATPKPWTSVGRDCGLPIKLEAELYRSRAHRCRERPSEVRTFGRYVGAREDCMIER